MMVNCWFGWDPRDTPRLTIPFTKSWCWFVLVGQLFEVTDLGIQELLCALAKMIPPVTPVGFGGTSEGETREGGKPKKKQNRGR